LISAHRKIQRLQRKALRRNGKVEARLDLQNCSDVDSGAMLLLIHSGVVLARRDISLVVMGPSPAFETVNRHLNHLRATKAQRSSIPAPPEDYLLRGVTRREDMVTEIESWAEGLQKAADADREEVALWQIQLAEVTTNSFQHGGGQGGGRPPPTILVAGKATLSDGWVQIAALDLGSGIPKVIERALSGAVEGMHDGQKIAHACEPGVTSRCDRLNQGAGLAGLVRAVQNNGGRLQILSRNGLAHVSNGRMYPRKLPARASYPSPAVRPWLDGTLTIINLRLNSKR